MRGPIGVAAIPAGTVTDVSQPFSLPVVPRYAEIDQQGVVFNGHYLTWFDEASTAYFEDLGISFEDLNADRYDLKVRHAEVDYLASVRWRDEVRVAVCCTAIGATSITLEFDVWRRGAGDGGPEVRAVTGRNVYVVVSTEDWAKRPVPEVLRSAIPLPPSD